jgi:histone acetyltransferase SAS3
VEQWRCKTCVENGLEVDQHNAQTTTRRRTSVPKVARELLPSHRSGLKPDSHSVFNALILDDDPMDGSRSLRKRKESNEAEHPQRPVRKRRRTSDVASASAGADQESSAPPSPITSRATHSEDALNGHHDAAVEESNVRSSRLRRNRKSDKGPVHIVSSEGISLIISFNLPRDKIQKILSSRPRKNRARDRSRKKIQPPPIQEPEPDHYPSIPSTHNAMFFNPPDREDDPRAKPYGGILSEAEADTSKTFPQLADRKRFEDARLKAEDDWRKKMAASNNMPEPTKPSQKQSGPPSKIKCISFGGYEIDTWHAAPYPEEYSRNKILYICEFCLKYMNSDYVAWRHKLKCPSKHPPGDEIYRDGKYSFFEVDGRKNPVYCQNLCLLAKLFLGSKTLYYDVEPFLFYVMTENDEFGCHFVGYFSKEKRPSSLNNVSCILVLPIFQRRGFGHMLIDFSYLLTRVEKKTGSPEKPLSDMGLVSYRGYWRLMMCYHLVDQKTPIRIPELAERTGMTPDDIVSALEGLRALVRDPVTKTYALRIDYNYFKEYVEKHEKKNYPKINPNALIWVPYVMNRGLERHYEDTPALHTVAQREEEEVDEEMQDAQENIETKEGALTNGETPFDTDTGMPSPTPAPNSQPATPLPNGISNNFTTPATHAIPPSRYEVFPPIPGMSARRRPGRPFGSRTRNHTMTPIKRNASNFSANGAIPGPGSPLALGPITNGRRTRSMLAEDAETVNGDVEADEDAMVAQDDADNKDEQGAEAADAEDEGGDEDAEGEDE